VSESGTKYAQPVWCKRTAIVKTDIELKRDVERALEWEPSIDAREIAVTVKNTKPRRLHGRRRESRKSKTI
jgi:hypothetical protein